MPQAEVKSENSIAKWNLQNYGVIEKNQYT